MPLRVSSAFDQRLVFVHMVRNRELNVSDACREFGISRPTGYDLLHRFALEGEEGLKDRSRAPLHHPQAVPQALADRVLALRTRYPTWGPKKIKAYLYNTQPDIRWPAASTIGELLKDNNMVKKRRFRHRAPAAALSPIERPNQVWCADYKGQFPLATGQLCYPLTLTDADSRYLLRCQALPDTATRHAWPTFVGAFHEFGLPDVIRTDNGAPFASKALAGISRLSLWWIKLGIVPERIAPGHPEQNGRHERMHRTLKAEAIHPTATTLRAQQRGFDQYRSLFNNQRPHEALQHKTPASCYAPSPRPYPRRLPSLQYPEDMTVRKVRPNGCLRIKGHELFLSEVLIGEAVGLDRFDEGLIALWTGFLPIAIINEVSITLLSPKKAATYLNRLYRETQPSTHNV